MRDLRSPLDGLRSPFGASRGPTGPTNTVAPVVSGTATVGQTLSTTNGTWSGVGTITYAYQWLDDGAAISGATSSTYTLTAGEEGGFISCRVTATDDNGSTAATSNSVGPVAASSFDPTDLFVASETGLIWDFSDASTVFQDAGVTAAGNGDPLGQVNDLSGNSVNGTQTVTASKPTLTQSGSIWGISLDGGDSLNFTTVGNVVTVGIAYTMGAGETQGLFIHKGASPYQNVFQDGGTLAVQSGFAYQYLRVNGSGLGTISRDALHDAMAATTGRVAVLLSEHTTNPGATSYSIGDFGAGFSLTGTIHAMVIIDRALTAGEQSDLETWLATKSGATL